MHNKRTEEELFDLARAYVEQAEKDAKANPTSTDIQVVVVEPMKLPYKKTIPNTLDAMNGIVGGYIEIVRMGQTVTGGSLAITLNEEGKIMNLPFNRRMIFKNGSDVFVGTFFITAFNMQGDNVSLKDEECDVIMKKFRGMEVYL
jgi:hypothetical protein